VGNWNRFGKDVIRPLVEKHYEQQAESVEAAAS
jgi:hypothetical protein